jgi:hypothetical protein
MDKETVINILVMFSISVGRGASQRLAEGECQHSPHVWRTEASSADPPHDDLTVLV